jgi:SnoaL-like domain
MRYLRLAVQHLRAFLRPKQSALGPPAVASPLSAEDRLEIQELIARYNFAEDSGAVEDWVNSFTADGSFTGQRKGVFVTGREQLRQYGTERQQRSDVGHYVHWTGNIIITPTAEGARAQCYVMMIEQTADGGLRVRGMSTKSDELRRESGRWRFKSRINTPWPFGAKP